MQKTRSSLSNTIKHTSTIMHVGREGLRMIVLVCLIVLLRELLVSTIFCMVHPYIAIHSVDFYTCYTYFLALRKKVKVQVKVHCTALSGWHIIYITKEYIQ